MSNNGMPVELELSKILQKLKTRLEKHDPPSSTLLSSVLDCFAQTEAPLSCTKIVLENMDIFLRLIREFDPSIYTKSFCLVLTIFRQLCKIAGKPARGRKVVGLAKHDEFAVEEAADLDYGDGTERVGHDHDEDIDANGYRLMGIIERMVVSDVVTVVTEAALSCSEPTPVNITIHNDTISLFCDFALEEKACYKALPSAMLQLLAHTYRNTGGSGSCSGERLCKRTAVILLSRICSDPCAKSILLNSDVTNPNSVFRRQWVKKALPHLWHMLLDTHICAKSKVESSGGAVHDNGDGNLSELATETLAHLYIALNLTEIGSDLANTLSGFLLAGCSDIDVNGDGDGEQRQSGSHGSRIISDHRYIIPSTLTDPDTESVPSSPNTILAGVHVITRIIEDVVDKMPLADNEVSLASLRVNGVFSAMYLCYTKQCALLVTIEQQLQLLHEQMHAYTQEVESLAQQEHVGGKTAKMAREAAEASIEATEKLDRITVAYRQHRSYTRDMRITQQVLCAAIKMWLQNDNECAWEFRMLLQQHHFHPVCGDDGDGSNSGDCDNIWNYVDLPLSNRTSSLTSLENSLMMDLNPSSRLVELRSELDSAIAASDLYSQAHIVRKVYEPAYENKFPATMHNMTRTQTHDLHQHQQQSLRKDATITLASEKYGVSGGMLGYLLLKRLYERNGLVPQPAPGSPSHLQQLRNMHITTSSRQQYDNYASHCNMNHMHNRNTHHQQHHHAHDGTPATDEDLDKTIRLLEMDGMRPTTHRNAHTPDRAMNSRARTRSHKEVSPRKLTLKTQKQQMSPKPPSESVALLSPRGRNRTPDPPSHTKKSSVKRTHYNHAQNKKGESESDENETYNLATKYAPYSIDTLLALAGSGDGLDLSFEQQDERHSLQDQHNATIKQSAIQEMEMPPFHSVMKPHSTEEQEKDNVSKSNYDGDASSGKFKGMKLGKIKITRSPR